MRTTWSDFGRACRTEFRICKCVGISLMILMMFYHCHGRHVIDPDGLTFRNSNTSALRMFHDQGGLSMSKLSTPSITKNSTRASTDNLSNREVLLRNFLLDNGKTVPPNKMTTKRHIKDEEDDSPEYCGDGIVGEAEDCDCGGVTNCSLSVGGKCCDPLTCRLLPGAQCAADGPCCSKECQFKGSGQVCRPIRNSCDLPEVCSGSSSHCPPDAFRRNGDQCTAQQGYCFKRQCITHDQQCVSIWGFHSTSGKEDCYNQFNARGSFNGNCGLLTDGVTYRFCKKEDVMCGVLQCKGGGYTPSASSQRYFATTILTNASGTLVQCKTFTPEVITSQSVQVTLVQDGTKCDHEKICLRNKCMPFKHLLPEFDCPSYSSVATCSGHGICTDLNTCFCESGYHGEDCSSYNNHSTQTLDRLAVQDLRHFRRGMAPLDDSKRRTNYNQIVNNEALQLVVVIMSVVLLGATLGIMSLTCCRGHWKSQQRPNVALVGMNSFAERSLRKMDKETDDPGWSLTSSV
ncbi:hypothetical protein RvY_00714-2 [Ramazzottius varieornatus]|uniref:EGF-like domain-containing protein n=2 Tax=Ramazzottius varieornatus TaxID=947166 RepID=A0A1D1UP36_RAMVA|nr:hypothetical protein RvY_00714-2 [Ramazzottius varieornatus]